MVVASKVVKQVEMSYVFICIKFLHVRLLVLYDDTSQYLPKNSPLFL